MKALNPLPTHLTCAGLAVCLAVAGCGPGSDDRAQSPPSAVASHQHPTEGPRHGSLIELGNEEYHAELVHDVNGGAMTVYLLDSLAKSDVPIDAPELTVNLNHSGQARQFVFAADPQTTDPPGQSSRFSSTDAELAEILDQAHVDAQLVVTVRGRQYRGALHHEHNHEGHGHGH